MLNRSVADRLVFPFGILVPTVDFYFGCGLKAVHCRSLAGV